MSRVFRSYNTVSSKEHTKHIDIRSLAIVQELDIQEELTVDVVLAERDRLLSEAHMSIADELQAIEQMRQTATEDIATMQSLWNEEKATLQQQAYDEGFQVGHEDGRKKALSDMETSIQIANETTKLSAVNADKYLVSQEHIILELAMRSAERIIGQSLEDDDEIFLSIVKRALKEAREMKEIKLYISPFYYELISTNRSELASIFPPDVPFLIFVNDDFETTQCFIETNHGRIVVSIDEQLNELRERLIEIMESGD